MSRSRAAILNWSASILFMAVTMAIGLITTPMIYRPLGVDRFGIVRTMTGIFGYFTLIAQGLTVAFIPLLANANAQKDEETLRRMLSTAFRCYALTASVILVIGLMAIPLLGYMFPLPPSFMPEVRVSWLVCIAGLPLLVVLPLKILIEVDQRGYLVTFSLLAQSVVTTILSVVFVRRGWGVTGVMAATLLGTAVFSVSVYLIARRNYISLLRGIHNVPSGKEDWRAVGSLSWPTFLTMLGTRIGVMSDPIILTAVRGPASATVLVMNQRLATMVEGVVRAFNDAIWPGLVHLHGNVDRASFVRRFAELVRIISVLSISALVPVVALNAAFVMSWIDDPAVHPSTTVAAVAALDAFLVCISGLMGLPLVSTGKVKMIMVPSLIAAGINLVISVVGAHFLGAVGPLIGTAAALLMIDFVYLPRLLRQHFGISPASIFQSMALPIAWGAPYAALVWACVDWLRPTGLILMFCLIAGFASVFVAFSYVAILDKEERDLWKLRLLAPLLSRIRSQ